MIYRKHPPQPTRLLLRIAAAAGTGVLLGAAACSASSSSGGGDTSNVQCGGGPCGAIDGSPDAYAKGIDAGILGPIPETGDEEYSNPCENLSPNACGLGTNPYDASPDAYPNGIDAGILMPMPDASDKDAPIADATGDAPFRCLGVCIEPDAESLAETGFHGIILGVAVRPDE